MARADVASAVAAAVAPLGLVAFMAYGWAMVGTPVAFLSAERFWQGQHFVWFLTPVEALIVALTRARARWHSSPTPWPGRLAPRLLRDLAARPHARRGPTRLEGRGRRRPGQLVGLHRRHPLIAYSAYFTDSIPRYTMAAFPLFAAFAWKLPRSMEGVVVGVMACLQGALLVCVLGAAVHPMTVPIIP